MTVRLTGPERTKVVVLSSWEQAVAARKLMGGLAAANMLAACAATLAMLIGAEKVRWIAVILSLLSCHALTGYFAWTRIAQLQAKIDMMRIARGQDVE